MITEVNEEFYKKFPRAYPTAETYGFTQQDIQKLTDILKSDQMCMDLYSNEDHLQVVLKMIIVRLKLERDEFFNYILSNKWPIYWRQEDYENAASKVGRYSLPAFVTIVDNSI